MGVILAGGKGARMLPFSEDIPKPLLPVVDRTILEHLIANLRDARITEIVIVVGHLGHKISERVGNGTNLGVHITYVPQKSALGIGHALALAEKHVSKPFVLALGDLFVGKPCLRPFADDILDPSVDGVLGVVNDASIEAIKKNFEVMADADDVVLSVTEKPRYPKSTTMGNGIFAFKPTILIRLGRHREPPFGMNTN